MALSPDDRLASTALGAVPLPRIGGQNGLLPYPHCVST